MNDGISNIADIITIIAGTMTILGISGFLTWSMFKEKNGLLSDKLLSIFSYSIKCALCLAILPFIGLLVFFPWIFAVSLAGGDTSGFPFSGRELPLGNYIGTFIIALLIVPIYVVICSCILEWSFMPLSRFAKAFSRKKDV